MKRIGVLVLSSVRESLRDRLLLGLLGVEAVAMLMIAVMAPMALGAREKAFHDFGLAWIHLSGLLMLLVVGSWSLHRERDRGIWLTILTRPVSRVEYVLGRLIGLLTTLAVTLLASAALYAAIAPIAGLRPSDNLGLALLYAYLELGFLAGLILLFSTFTGFGLTVFMAATVFMAGHLSGDLLRFASLTDSGGARALATACHWLLPRLDLYRVRDALVSGQAPGLAAFARAAAYSLFYLGALGALAVAIFQRREIR